MLPIERASIFIRKFKNGMLMSLNRLITCVAASVLALSLPVMADGLTELNNALDKLNGKSTIMGTLETAYQQERGRKKKIKKTNGYASVKLIDDINGLQVVYSSETLAKIAQEENEKQSNEEANTPTLNAIDDIDAGELSNMLSAAAQLRRSLNKAKFTREEVIDYQGKEMRELHFDLPLEAIITDKEVRSYVNDFKGDYSVVIDEAGVPVQSKLSFDGKGSIYIFFKLSINQSMTYFYQVVDDRLVNYRKQFERKQKSTWDQRDSSGYTEIQISEDKAQQIAFDR